MFKLTCVQGGCTQDHRRLSSQVTGALAGILLLVFGVYLPCIFSGFSLLDDYSYVVNNPLVTQLSFSSVASIFTTFTVGNYNPLAVLVFAVEHRFFGMNPSWFHLTNILIHLLNTFLVFRVMALLTRRTAHALIISLFFAIHPMHVESVVWISATKDTLFLFFYLAGMQMYLNMQEMTISGRKWACGFMLGCLLLSLGAKPTAVSFPLVLLLIDYYRGKLSWDAVRSKVIFFLPVVLFGLVALSAAHTPYASYETPPVYEPAYSFGERLLLSCAVFWSYVGKLFWPFGLSVFYPYPSLKGFLFGEAVAAVFLLVLFFVARKLFRREKVLVFGLGFFLVTIFFNLPLFNIGYSLSGDRFTYLPYLGLFLILVHYGEMVIRKMPLVSGKLWAVCMTAGVLALSGVSLARCLVWRNDAALWMDVIKKTPGYSLGYVNLAEYYYRQGRYEQALQLCQQAVKLQGNDYAAFYCIGNVYLMTGKWPEAKDAYQKAVGAFPYYHQAYVHLGIVEARQGDFDAALRYLNKALELQPEYPVALFNRGMIYAHLKKVDQALADLRRLVALDPSNAAAKNKIKELAGSDE